MIEKKENKIWLFLFPFLNIPEEIFTRPLIHMSPDFYHVIGQTEVELELAQSPLGVYQVGDERREQVNVL